MKLFLDEEEMHELTGRERRDAQVKQLRHMGIEHRVRADGTVAVLKSHIDKTFDGVAEKTIKLEHTEPNWSGVC